MDNPKCLKTFAVEFVVMSNLRAWYKEETKQKLNWKLSSIRNGRQPKKVGTAKFCLKGFAQAFFSGLGEGEREGKVFYRLHGSDRCRRRKREEEA